MVAVDVFSGPIAFAVIAFMPAALSQLAQFAFACTVARHLRSLFVVACLLRHESGHLAHLVGARP